MGMSNDAEQQASEAIINPFKSVVDKAKVQEAIGEAVNSWVEESEALRGQTIRQAGETTGVVKGRVNEIRNIVEEVKAKAVGTLDSLEQLFEDRVAHTLKRLGVPTRDDVQGIAKRLEEINALLKTLVDDQQVVDKAAPPNEKDDLKLINGIGPVLEGKLNGVGVCSYRQIAMLTDAEIERIESEVIHSSGRVRREDWIGQAQALYLRQHGKPLS